MKLIDADALRQEVERIFTKHFAKSKEKFVQDTFKAIFKRIDSAPTIEARPVVRGEWIYEAHKETANDRWNVTAYCSECCDEEKEVWAGFFPNVPDWLARDVALQSAKSVKPSNFCPNCGAEMRKGEDDG